MGDFVLAGVSVGPYDYGVYGGGGYDFGKEEGYHDAPERPDHPTFGNGVGIDVGASTGLEVVGYISSTTCGCNN